MKNGLFAKTDFLDSERSGIGNDDLMGYRYSIGKKSRLAACVALLLYKNCLVERNSRLGTRDDEVESTNTEDDAVDVNLAWH